MLESVLAVFARAEVDFIVVGGLAVAQAGFARFTEDIDLLVEADRANLGRLIGVLAGMGDGAAADLSPEDFPLEEGAIRVLTEDVIDLFTLMSGHTYEDLVPLSVVAEVDGQPVRFLGAEGLLRLKGDSLRPKDQIDAQVLRRLLDDPSAD